ncbi:hypothetical protein Taro_048188 [Colocasia esculenta]|uniref:DNA-directed RNA polymerase N-terminal domain-containing protein n=1 Tax=Colocasia esculenta TaxID=4460 RepID=A0A843X297_COLES|nr:hypothetical protein [Colocasia esculenta]
MRAGGLSQLKPQGNPPFPQNPSPPCPIPRWVLHSSLRSSSFPAGSEPPEADHAFPAVFSHLGSSQAAHLVEDTGELGKDSVARCVEEALRFGWSGKGIPLLLFGREVKRVFYEDPPWFSVAFSPLTDVLRISRKSGAQDVGKWKYNALRRRQIKMETEAWERAAEEYRELQREMLEKKLAPCLPYVKSLMLGWFEPLRDAIAREQNLQKNKEKKTRASYAPYIGLLPADKMAVIVMHKMMGLLVTGQEEGCVRVVQAAVHIGEAIEHEVRIHNFLQKTKKTGDGDQHTQHVRLIKQHEILRKRVRNLTKCRKSVEVCKLLKSDDDIKSWGRDAQAKLGSCLIELLVESAFVQPPVNSSVDSPPDIRPAFRHTFRPVSQEDRKSGKRYGVIECDMLVHKGLDSTAQLDRNKGMGAVEMLNGQSDQGIR